MRRRLTATLTTLCAAVVTLSSALALGEPAGDPQATTITKVEVRPAPPPQKAGAVAKPAAPVAKVFMKAVPVRPGFPNQAQVQQYIQQFRPILRAEYHIVRVVCNLTPEQRLPIARDGERTLREAARNYAVQMQRPMTAQQRAALDPRKQIRDGLSKSIKARLSPEMVERYKEEIARRVASHKRLAVRNLVARMDHDLLLTRDQRDKVEASLTQHWDDSWCQSIQMLMHNNQFLPPIPDHYVAPFLNDAQKAIWRTTQKFYGVWGGIDVMGGIRIDDPLEDQELRVARLEAAKDDPRPDPRRPPPPVMIHDVMVKMAPVEKAAAKPAAKAKAKAVTKIQIKGSDAAKEKAVPKP